MQSYIRYTGKDGGGNGMIDALIGSEMLKKLQKANEETVEAKTADDKPEVK